MKKNFSFPLFFLLINVFQYFPIYGMSHQDFKDFLMYGSVSTLAFLGISGISYIQKWQQRLHRIEELFTLYSTEKKIADFSELKIIREKAENIFTVYKEYKEGKRERASNKILVKKSLSDNLYFDFLVAFAQEMRLPFWQVNLYKITSPDDFLGDLEKKLSMGSGVFYIDLIGLIELLYPSMGEMSYLVIQKIILLFNKYKDAILILVSGEHDIFYTILPRVDESFVFYNRDIFTEYKILDGKSVDYSGLKKIKNKCDIIANAYKNFQDKKIDILINKILIKTRRFDEIEFHFLVLFAGRMNIPFYKVNIDKIVSYDDFLADLEERMSLSKNIFYINVDDFYRFGYQQLGYEKASVIFHKTLTLFDKHKNSILFFVTSDKNIFHANAQFFQEAFIFPSIDIEIKISLIKKIMENSKKYFDDTVDALYIAEETRNFSSTDLQILCDRILILTGEDQCITKKIVMLALKDYQEKSHLAQKPQNCSVEAVEEFDFSYVTDFSFKDLAGYDKQKRELLLIGKEVIESKVTKGVLLWGPPGNGKTAFAKALAGELHLPFFNISAAELESPWVGITEKNIYNLFLAIQNESPCIVFIDEFEGLAPNRNAKGTMISSYRISVVNVLLELLDGLKKKGNFIFMIASNYPEMIDQAVLRNGRIDKKIKIDYPKEQDRIKILQMFFEKYTLLLDTDMSLDSIAKDLEGFSSIDLVNYVQNIAKELYEQENKTNVITKKNLLDNYKKLQKENNFSDFQFHTVGINFSDIGGYLDMKEDMQREIIDKLKSQNILDTKITGMILTGAPGTGKTLLAKAIAGEAGVPLLSINKSLLIENYPHAIEKMFAAIQKNRPCVVLFDEIESVFLDRKYGNNQFSDNTNEFLQKTGGVDSMKGVFFIGTANNPELIDPAIIRKGRLGNIIRLKYPEYCDRLDIIRLYLTKYNIILDENILIEKIAERTDGMSPADIEDYLEIVKMIIEKEGKTTADKKDFAEAYQQVFFGKKIKSTIMPAEEIEQTAYHEACHGLLTFILNRQKEGYYFFDFLTIEQRAETLGVSYSRKGAQYKSMTKNMLLGLIAIGLAGKAGQEVLFNITDAGAGQDLAQVSQIAEDLIKKYGMGRRLQKISNEKNSVRIEDEIEEILQKEYQKVKEFIKIHRVLIDKIVALVLERKTIYEKELAEIVTDYEKEINQKVVYSFK